MSLSNFAVRKSDGNVTLLTGTTTISEELIAIGPRRSWASSITPPAVLHVGPYTKPFVMKLATEWRRRNIRMVPLAVPWFDAVCKVRRVNILEWLYLAVWTRVFVDKACEIDVWSATRARRHVVVQAVVQNERSGLVSSMQYKIIIRQHALYSVTTPVLATYAAPT